MRDNTEPAPPYGVWCEGRMAASEAGGEGSIPSTPTILNKRKPV